MFATDSFLSAELTYRTDRVRRDWGRQGSLAASRRKKDADTPSTR